MRGAARAGRALDATSPATSSVRQQPREGRTHGRPRIASRVGPGQWDVGVSSRAPDIPHVTRTLQLLHDPRRPSRSPTPSTPTTRSCSTRSGTGASTPRGSTFTHRRDHTAALNRLAGEGGADVVAVSLGAYPALARRVPAPAARRVRGARLRARRRRAAAHDDGASSRARASASRGARRRRGSCCGSSSPRPRASRSRSSRSRASSRRSRRARSTRRCSSTRAGCSTRERGLHKVVDLGEWWQAEAGLPLPLGVNVIRRALGRRRR